MVALLIICFGENIAPKQHKEILSALQLAVCKTGIDKKIISLLLPESGPPTNLGELAPPISDGSFIGECIRHPEH